MGKVGAASLASLAHSVRCFNHMPSQSSLLLSHVACCAKLLALHATPQLRCSAAVQKTDAGSKKIGYQDIRRLFGRATQVCCHPSSVH
jgi:hypothetical protein